MNEPLYIARMPAADGSINDYLCYGDNRNRTTVAMGMYKDSPHLQRLMACYNVCAGIPTEALNNLRQTIGQVIDGKRWWVHMFVEPPKEPEEDTDE